MLVRVEQAKLFSIQSSRLALNAFGMWGVLTGVMERGGGFGVQTASGMLSFNPLYQPELFPESFVLASVFQMTSMFRSHFGGGSMVGAPTHARDRP